MKKTKFLKSFVSLIVVVSFVFSLSGCSFNFLNDLIGKFYEAPKEEVKIDGLTITLTKAFAKMESEEYDYLYDAKDAAVIVLKQSFAEYEGFIGNSLDEYAEATREANAKHSPSEIKKEDYLTAMEYKAISDVDGKEYTYYAVFYSGSDAFWTIQFFCLSTDYEAYKPYFVEYAKSVTIDKSYEFEANEFSTDEFSFTATKAFCEVDQGNEKEYEGVYYAKDTSIFVLNESFSLFDKETTLMEYASLVRDANKSNSPSAIKTEDGITYIELKLTYSQSVGVKTDKCMVAMFKGTEAFWMVQFSCEAYIYDEYKPYFVEWAKSINVK